MLPNRSALANPDRLEAVRRTGLLEASAGPAFDRLARMAAKLLDAPMAVISLITDDFQQYLSQTGTPEPLCAIRGVGLDRSICQLVIATSEPVVIEDIRTDPRVAHLRDYAELGLISYLGVPMRGSDGFVVGVVCVLGNRPREWGRDDLAWLEQVAESARDELALRAATQLSRAESILALDAAARLASSHDLLTRLAQQVPGVIYQYQRFPDGRACFPYASSAMRDIYGVSPEDVQDDAEPVMAVLHPEDLAATAASIDLSAATLLAWRHEYRAIVAGKGVIWLRGDAQPEQLADGSILWHGFIMDITVEKAQQQARAELELQLQHAQKMEAIGTLAGGIAHDFNNVLSGILGNIEAARADLMAGQDPDEALADAVHAARRARALVAQILGFSRRRPPERAVAALWPVVEEARRLVRATLPATIAMEAFVDDPAACAYIDSTQVHQVVLNLCTNAAAAIPSGDGRIVIRQQRVAVHDGEVGTVEPLPAGDYIRLTVSDNGEGMDEEMRRRIFEPFFTTRSSLGGTGLGLTMVHAIVRSHDGGVVVTSKRGLGTTIHVYLPLARTAALAPAAAVAAAPVRTAVRAGLRVLVVDDDESVGRATQRLLVRMGHVPTVFARPREALEWLRRAPAQVDAVITDLTMPGMNGAELAAAVRRLRPDLPIILSSGMLDDDIRAQAEIGGVATVLSKPYTASELAAALAASGEGEVTPAAGGGPPAVGG